MFLIVFALQQGQAAGWVLVDLVIIVAGVGVSWRCLSGGSR